MRAVKTNPDAAFKLIKKKKDINATNVKGQTALMMAVENNPQLVAPLIEYGANVNIFDKDGNTPLMLAKKYALDVVDILTAAGAKNVKPVMQPGMLMPNRIENPAISNRVLKISVMKNDNLNEFNKKMGDSIRDFIEELIERKIVSENDKIKVLKLRSANWDNETTKFMLDEEVVGFRIDLDARFSEYPEFFKAGENINMIVSEGKGLLKLKNLMHVNWKEAKKYALNTEDEKEVMDIDPISLDELETDDDDAVCYFRDKNGILRLVELERFKDWLKANRINRGTRGMFGDSYDQREIRGLLQLVNDRADFNTVISVQNIGVRVGTVNTNISYRNNGIDRVTNTRNDIVGRVTNSLDLMNAVRNRPADVESLIDAGADVNAVDRNGHTVLMLAVSYQPSVVQTLLDAGAHVYTTNHVGWTALMIAVLSQPSVIQTLLDAGANVNAANHNGHTALMIAASYQPSVVQTLIDAGAHLFAVDHDGRTALHYAIEKNNQGAIRRLRLAATRR